MKRRILIVEDEAVTSVMLEKTLKELGYEVVGSAFDGSEAINLVKEKKPDIVLMDIRIQGEMDGIETAKKIYQQFNVPIIYLTAHSDDDTIRRAVESGPFGYLIKPFKERELYSNIEMVAHKHKLFHTTTTAQPTTDPERAQEPRITSQKTAPLSAQSPIFKPGDYRLAILAIQSIPNPVILFNTSGNIVFLNNAGKNFFKPQSTTEILHSILDLPELFNKIWASGLEKFEKGKGFAISGTLSIRNATKRVRIEMIPLMDRGVLQFISSILLMEPAGIPTINPAMAGMNTLLDEAEGRLREIRYLASTEETYRLRRISLYSTDVLKKIREIREISHPEEEKEKGNLIR
jgi:DNA-binding NarL/FixJ family response regulator